MKKVSFILFISMLFCSCISFPRSSSFYVESKELVPFDYNIRDVSVSIDYVNEEIIADQVRNLIETTLIPSQIDSESIINLDINIIQRSFIQNIEQKNSIYINFVGYDENEDIVVRENYYVSGNQTFVSSVDQYDCIKRILNKLISFQDSIRKEKIKENEK